LLLWRQKGCSSSCAQDILNVGTGDSAILTSKITFDRDVIVHQGTYTEGSGDSDFNLDFQLSKCQQN